MLLAVFLIAAAASAEPISLDAYLGELEKIRVAFAAKDLATARRLAEPLVAADVAATSGDRFHADDALLSAIAGAKKHDRVLQQRLTATIDELRRSAPESTTPADAKLLERVTDEQRVAELQQGGTVDVTAGPGDNRFGATVVRAIGETIDWIGELLVKILDWIFDFLPGRKKESGSGSVSGPVIVVVTLIVIALIALALRTIFRARPALAAPAATSEPISSRADEDPLSRGASEWERHAANLAANGRWREAIRAWYHAVLVTLYGAGILHYRKGRTNWEYVAVLPANVAWRAEFIELTRRFEEEWYGSLDSTPEAHDECGARARAILDTLRRGFRGAA
ncbi:MAG TPA: DUF4129 domain-containing protein [Thermoanaerobaculia bacterium]|jgi:hypothetical protein